MLTPRENWLRAATFRCPEWIPCSVGFSPLTWKKQGPEIDKILLAHPTLFPEHKPGSVRYDRMPPVHRQGEYFRDNWGCLWYNVQDGLEGQVVGHPLADWDALATWQPPDPMTKEERGERDWAKIEKDVAERKARGQLTWGNGERLFDRLYFLRGFENLMMDFATDDPRLPRLIEVLTDYEMRLVNRWLGLGVDGIGFHTDIGTQTALMISPAKFRRYVKPMFATLFQACRRAGAVVSLSSDGCLLEIVDDLIECGVTVHDPQLRANTLDGIVRAYKGKLCACVDLDRQSFPFLSPAALRQQVKDVVDAMASPEGGLMLVAAFYGADIPLANIEAVCDAMERRCFP
jgi:uroporphyrinogen decarboxylase